MKHPEIQDVFFCGTIFEIFFIYLHNKYLSWQKTTFILLSYWFFSFR